MPVLSDAPIAGRIDYDATRARSDAFIRRHGMRAALKRYGSPDRPCDVVLIEWSAQELLGRQYDPLTRKAVMAAGNLDIPPIMDLDSLVTFVQPVISGTTPVVDEILKIIARPEPLKPAGVIVQWVMAVRA